MNEEERKAWAKLVEDSKWCLENTGYTAQMHFIEQRDRAILSADAELTALREENRRLREAIEWAIAHPSSEVAAKPYMPQHEITEWWRNELRRRAGGGDG